MANGIVRISSVIDTFILRLILSMDCAVKPLGLPQAYPEGQAVAVTVDMTKANLEAIRRTRGVNGPVLASHHLVQSRIPAIVRLPTATAPHALSVPMPM